MNGIKSLDTAQNVILHNCTNSRRGKLPAYMGIVSFRISHKRYFVRSFCQKIRTGSTCTLKIRVCEAGLPEGGQKNIQFDTLTCAFESPAQRSHVFASAFPADADIIIPCSLQQISHGETGVFLFKALVPLELKDQFQVLVLHAVVKESVIPDLMVGCQPAAGNDTVHVDMVVQFLVPGVEHLDDPGRRTKIFLVG